MHLILLCFLVSLLTISGTSKPCNPFGKECVGWYEYQMCVNINDGTEGVLVGQIQTCPEGTICTEDYFPCKIGTIPPTTTTPVPVTEPACFQFSKFPAPSCTQYYQCEPVFWWWAPKLKTCPDGQAFDPSTSECVAGADICKTTTTTTTTTTTVAPVILPKCDGAGKYPALQENQYYECKYAWFKWRLYLVTCSKGQVFDGAAQECVAAAAP